MQDNALVADDFALGSPRAEPFADNGGIDDIDIADEDVDLSSVEEEWINLNSYYSNPPARDISKDSKVGIAVVRTPSGAQDAALSDSDSDSDAKLTLKSSKPLLKIEPAKETPTIAHSGEIFNPSTNQIKLERSRYDDNLQLKSIKQSHELPETPAIASPARQLPKLQITSSPNRPMSIKVLNMKSDPRLAPQQAAVSPSAPPPESPEIQLDLCEDDDDNDDWIDPLEPKTPKIPAVVAQPKADRPSPKPSLFKPSLFNRSSSPRLDSSFDLQQELQESLSDEAPQRKRLRKALSNYNDVEPVEERFSDDKIAAEFDEMLGDAAAEEEKSSSYEVIDGPRTELDELLGDDAPKRRRKKRKSPTTASSRSAAAAAKQTSKRRKMGTLRFDDEEEDDDFIENPIGDDGLYDDDDEDGLYDDDDDKELLADVIVDGDDDDEDFQKGPSAATKRRTRTTYADLKKSVQTRLKFGARGEDEEDLIVDDDADDDAATPNKKKKRKPRNSAVGYLDSNGAWVVDGEIVEDDLGDKEDAKPSIENEQIEEVGDLILSAPGEVPVHVVPSAINNRLRQYQRDGVKFLYSLFRKDTGGILGDDMGLGKTIQTIAFVYGIFPQKVDSTNESLNNSWISQSPVKAEQKPAIDNPPQLPPQKHMPVLIVVPGSVLYNWDKEFNAWGRIADRKFNIYMHHGSNRRATKNSLQAKDIVLTTYDLFRMEFEMFDAVDWLCIIFDEVHKIKDRKTKLAKTCMQLRHRRRFGLTGTVVQNNFEELYTLLDFVQPGALGTLHQFRHYYINPIKNGQKQDADFKDIAFRKHVVRKLNLEFKKIVLRRDKSVISDLLPKKTDNIVFCKMSELQVEIYKRVMQSENFAFMLKWVSLCPCGISERNYGKCCAVEQFDFKEHLLPAITNLMKVSNDLRLIIPKQELEEDSRQLKREQEFYSLAVGPDEKKFDALVRAQKDEELGGKLKSLRLLVDIWDEKGKKVLIFSSKTTLLDIIQRYLTKKINPDRISRLDGSTPIAQRQAILDDYSTSSQKRRFLFLISTKAGGLGLNITAAHTVVVFDPSWNATWDLQAQDRVHRIGQTKNTEIYRFVSQGSIEETIYNRQIYKQQMANISTQGSHERRFFKGVQGRRGEEGELFGLVNLLKFASDRIFTKEVVENEQQYVIKALEEAGVPTNDPQENPLLSEVFAADADAADADEIRQDGVYDLTALGRRVHGATPRVGEDIQSALLLGGVEYLHNNQKLVGNSKVEEFITSQAMRMHVDDVEHMASNVVRSSSSRASSRGALGGSGFLYGNNDFGVDQDEALRRRLMGDDESDDDDSDQMAPEAPVLPPALAAAAAALPSWVDLNRMASSVRDFLPVFEAIDHRRAIAAQQNPAAAERLPAERNAGEIAWFQDLKRKHSIMRNNVAERKLPPNQYKNYIVPSYPVAPTPQIRSNPMLSHMTSRDYKRSKAPPADSNPIVLDLVSPEKDRDAAIAIGDEDSDELMILDSKPSTFSQSFTQPLYQNAAYYGGTSPQRPLPASLRTEPALPVARREKSRHKKRKAENAPKIDYPVFQKNGQDVIDLVDDD